VHGAAMHGTPHRAASTSPASGPASSLPASEAGPAPRVAPATQATAVQ
jgi:hypothetical protein